MVKDGLYAYAKSEYAGIRTLESAQSEQSNNTPESITTEGKEHMVLQMVDGVGG